MFDVVPALSHRLSRLRAHSRVSRDDRSTAGLPGNTSLAETLAVGLGCDLYKHRS